jgi:hypothetical protein
VARKLYIFASMRKRSELNDIIKCCEARFNRGVATGWKHSDFNDLSREVLRSTKVNISPHTLKRIFGKLAVDDDYLPQQATIDALKIYSGYTNAESLITPGTKQRTQFRSPKAFIIIAVFIIVIVGLVLINLLSPASKLEGDIKVTETKGLLPTTAFFDLNVPGSEDSLFVNFGDKSTWVYVQSGQKSIVHDYLFPGVFKVTLQSRRDTLARAQVYVQSNKWIGLGYHRQHDLPDHYYEFPAEKTGPDSLFVITNSQLHKAGLDTTNSVYTRLCNFTPVKHDADNFIFETTFKNALSEKGVYCSSAQFQVSGGNGVIRFKLANPGCSSRVLNFVSEQVFDGTRRNLSQFVVDLKRWNAVKMINRNRQLSLVINGKLLFTGSYQKPLGGVKGVFIEFEGSGFVKNCNLKTLDGRMLYHF